MPKPASFKTVFLALLTFLMTAIFIACGTAEPEPEKHEYTRTYFDYFGSVVTVRIWGEATLDTATIFAEIDAILAHVHRSSTRYDPFTGVVNVHAINAAPDVWHDVDPMLIEMTSLGKDYYNHPFGGNVFNITLGEVIDVWGVYRERCLASQYSNTPDCAIPSLQELQAAAGDMSILNPNAIDVDAENNRLRIPEGLALDLGGIAKGYGAREVGRFLRTTAVSHFVVNAGASNIEFYGPHPSGERDHWTVGTRNPFNTRETYAQLRLYSGDNSVTSGDYERFYIVNGVAYHHIIDPHTLLPARHIRGTTIVGPDALLADIYSTLAFVLPIEAAIAFIDQLDDYEAVWMDAEGVVHFSAHFESKHLNELRLDMPVNESTPLFISLLGFVGFISMSVVMTTLKKRRTHHTST